MTPWVAFIGQAGGLLPDASNFAPRVDHVMRGLLFSSVAMVLLLTALTLFILVRYRSGTAADRSPVRTATWKIETAWIVFTTAVFLVFFAQGAAIYLDMRRVPGGLEEITVVGRQWMWDVRYSDGRREFNALHVRLNTPVRLVLSSEDVIHSFFVPAFRLKQDLVPGKVVDTWFKPTRAGTYSLFCAQYCGTAHAQMIGEVVVLAPEEFAAWAGGTGAYAGSASGEVTSAARGRAAYGRYGCASCHDGAHARGPSLAGLYGSPVKLGDGRFVSADEQYLHDAILFAPRTVVAGYPPAMPTYSGVIAESEVLDLIAYIKSLQRAPAPAS